MCCNCIQKLDILTNYLGESVIIDVKEHLIITLFDVTFLIYAQSV